MIWIIFGVIIFLLIVIQSKIYIKCNYLYTKNEQKLLITLTVFHIRIYKKEIKITEDSTDISFLNDLSFDSFGTKLKAVLHIVKQSGTIANLLLNRMDIHQLTWLTNGGTGEASTTGLASGAVWAIKGVFIGLIAENSKLKCKPIINVIPHYQYRYIQSKIDCIVSIRLGQAIYAFLKMMRLFTIKDKAYI